jgi:hypothetical protein
MIILMSESNVGKMVKRAPSSDSAFCSLLKIKKHDQPKRATLFSIALFK